MEPEFIKSISQEIYRRFPEVAGRKPQIRSQSIPHTKSTGGTYLLTYQSSVKSDDGQAIQRWVRVVVNNQGKILKISTSR